MRGQDSAKLSGMTSPDPRRDLPGKPVSESGATIPNGLLKDAGPETVPRRSSLVDQRCED